MIELNESGDNGGKIVVRAAKIVHVDPVFRDRVFIRSDIRVEGYDYCLNVRETPSQIAALVHMQTRGNGYALTRLSPAGDTVEQVMWQSALKERPQ